MKTFVLSLATILLVFAGPVSAQKSYPRGEFFAGFSWVDWDQRFGDRENLFGFQLSITANLTRNLGLSIVNGGGHWGSRNEQHHEFMLGPRIIGRGHRFSGFLHALGGFVLGRTGLTGFALGLGMGVDLNASELFAVRVLQLDYIPVRDSGQWSNDFRLGAGLVFKVAP